MHIVVRGPNQYNQVVKEFGVACGMDNADQGLESSIDPFTDYSVNACSTFSAVAGAFKFTPCPCPLACATASRKAS